MTKRMLVDATHPEETRVAIVESYRDINRLDDLDFGLASKPILRGNIYLAKVMRIEPSLQAAFVEYGGNRHGFLPFTEIHPDYFRIPMADRPHDEAELAEEQAEAEAIREDAIAEQDQGPDQRMAEGDDAEDENDSEAEEGDDSEADDNLGGLEPEQMPAGDAALLEDPIPAPLATHFGDDTDVGLITDFGNAAIMPAAMPADPALVEAVATAETVSNVGGEVAERFVRQHRPRYKIQEVLKRGQVMLIQVVKEERGNKGAALTTFLSLAGRYCVLMPNTDHGGGVSRKITNHQDRRRMKEILDQLEIPDGMAVILRTAGMEQAPPDIQRDLEYLLRMWDNIREQTLQSNAPALIYEEANLIKRSVRDLYTQDIAEILVAGEQGYERARDFMRTIMPDDVEKIKPYNDPIPLFFRYHVENQIDGLHSPTVQLRSGGYIVINPTEALVSIDVNSGRATRERHIEETAVKTNLEAADEIARQLRLRDLAGLVVIDFIDMEDGRNNAAVERRLKEAMKNDRARLQIGRISLFGLMELSRQRLRPSLLETNFEKCAHCDGIGMVRSTDSAALSILRAVEEEGIRQRASELVLHVPTKIALYILNQKRPALSAIEERYDMHVLLHSDDALIPPDYRIERSRSRKDSRVHGPAVDSDMVMAETERNMPPMPPRIDAADAPPDVETDPAPRQHEGRHFRGNERNDRGGRNSNRGDRNGGDRNRGNRDNNNRGDRYQNRQAQQPIPEGQPQPDPAAIVESADPNFNTAENGARMLTADAENQQRRRRRGRRGGRRRNGAEGGAPGQPQTADSQGGENANNGNRPPRQHNGGERQNNGGERQHNGDRPRNDRPRNDRPQNDRPRRSFPPAADGNVMPVNVQDIDTTPRPPSQPSPARYNQGDNAPRNYENVNPSSGDKPKGGWWRRLTGQ